MVDINHPTSTSARQYPTALRIGWAGSVAFVICAVILLARSDLKAFFGSDYANLGQFLSGVFAPLAFLWLVVAVLLQTSELELQREELKNSVDALRLQANETAALVAEGQRSATAAEAALGQQLAREEERRLNGLIDLLASRILRLAPYANVRDMHGQHFAFGEQTELENAREYGGQDAILSLGLEKLTVFNLGAGRSGAWQAHDPTQVQRQLTAIHSSVGRIIDGARAGKHRLVEERIEMLALELLSTQLEAAMNLYQQGEARGRP